MSHQLDPLLAPVLAGRVARVGEGLSISLGSGGGNAKDGKAADHSVSYDENFRLYLATRLPVM